jgi:PAS domain S-box-containing protein
MNMSETEDKTVLKEMDAKDPDFRALFLKSPVWRMLMSVEPDDKFLCVEVNNAAAGHFYIPREKMLGKMAAEVFDVAVAEQLETAMKSCIQKRKSETVNVTPRFPGGVRIQPLIVNPIFDAEGIARFIDIMARPEVSESVQLQRERDDAIMLMMALFDASGLGIVLTDHHGRIVRVNDTFVGEYGWQREDLLGEEFVKILPPEDHEMSRKLYAAFIDRGRQGSREIDMLRKDGTVAEIVMTTSLLELSNKRRFMVSTIRDTTERKNLVRNLRRAKEEADSASRAKSSFLANMSHELRTPLNAIIGFSELMKNKMFGSINIPKYEEYVTDIYFSAHHLLAIINDVLDMSKIEAGKIELFEREVSIGKIFEAVQRIMGDRAVVAKVNLVFEADESLPTLWADQRFLRQMLINLISNAVKFSEQDKTVTIRAVMFEDKHIRFSVEDEGCGIPLDKILLVQEPFGQVTDPRSYQGHGQGQGTGLGLPLSKAMIELHGGTFTIESEVGKGTKIYLDFPARRTMQDFKVTS